MTTSTQSAKEGETGSAITQALVNLLAQDIMSKPAICVHGNWTIKATARFLLEYGISGAPVIDEQEKMIGVVSATDILQFDSMSSKELRDITEQSYYQEYLGQNLLKEDLDRLSTHADETCHIDAIMTPVIISVSADATLPEIAHLMVEQKVHRLIVSEDDKLLGVISTVDILKALR